MRGRIISKTGNLYNGESIKQGILKMGILKQGVFKMRNLPICSRHYIKVFQITLRLVASRLGQFCENFENTREIIPLHPTESDVSVKRYPKN